MQATCSHYRLRTAVQTKAEIATDRQHNQTEGAMVRANKTRKSLSHYLA